MTKKVQHKNMTGTLSGGIELDGGSGSWKVEGNIDAAKETVKRSREAGRNKKSHYQHKAEIPYIIVVELLTKYGLDILDPDFMKDEAAKKRFMYLMKTEYPDLLVMT